MSHDVFRPAAQRVLDGDDSTEAAIELTRVVREGYPGDERFDDLLEVLARSAPEDEEPTALPEEVRTILRETMARVM